MGHDTTLDAISTLLDLQWQCGDFAADSTTPISGLLFEILSSGEVTIRPVCPALNDKAGAQPGLARFGVATRNGTDVTSNPVELSHLTHFVAERLDWACITEDC